MQPINYLMPQQNITENLLQGLQVGAMFGNLAQQSRQREEEQAAKEAAKQTEIQFKADMSEYWGNPTADKAGVLISKYPQFKDAFKESWNVLDKSQKEEQFGFGLKLESALSNGGKDTALELLNGRIEAKKNAGQDFTELEDMKVSLEAGDVNDALASTQIKLMSVDGERYSKIKDEYRKQQTFIPELQEKRAKAYREAILAENQNELSAAEIAAKTAVTKKAYNDITNSNQRLILDKEKALMDYQKMQKEMAQIPPAMEKVYSQSALDRIENDQAANAALDLANQFSQVKDVQGGFKTAANQWLKEKTGNEDSYTLLQKKYITMKNMIASKNIPKPASNVDIELFMKGFPSENASPEVLAEYLRQAAVVSKHVSLAEQAKQDWIDANKSMGRAKEETVINGIPVKAGMGFEDYQKAFVAPRISEFEQFTKGTAKQKIIKSDF